MLVYMRICVHISIYARIHAYSDGCERVSFNKTINGEKINIATKPSPYESLFDRQGKRIKGVKVHKENRSLYVDGLLRSKIVIKEGKVSKDKGKKTKDFLRESLPVGNYRQFRLNNVSVAKLNGETLILK